ELVAAQFVGAEPVLHRRPVAGVEQGLGVEVGVELVGRYLGGEDRQQVEQDQDGAGGHGQLVLEEPAPEPLPLAAGRRLAVPTTRAGRAAAQVHLERLGITLGRLFGHECLGTAPDGGRRPGRFETVSVAYRQWKTASLATKPGCADRGRRTARPPAG